MKLRAVARVVVLPVIVAAIGCCAAYWWALSYLHSPLPIEAPVTFKVERGATLNTVAAELAARGAMPHPRIWILYARQKGWASRIHAGEYEVPLGSTPASVLRRLVDGDVILRQLTVVEGSTFSDLRAAMRRHPSIQQTIEGLSDVDIMRRLGAGGTHPEGQFFPDTYRFAAGTHDFDILRRAHAEMQRRIAEAWKRRAPDLPLASPYEALILASIVEKETGLATERARIAGVFVRRLRLGMRLQSDPTVIYGLGDKYSGDIRRRDLRGDTTYNTYRRAGLPPTPIALPGEGALRAATRPDDTGAVFFVATGEPDGSHYFSRTLAEHNAAVRRFLARTSSNQGASR